MEDFSSIISQKNNLPIQYVKATLALLQEGATIPFIARYRKDKTGGMDEVQIAQISTEAALQKDLFDRRKAILSSIEEQGKLTDELKQKINSAETMTVLEDLYLPYKPKRKTKALIAKEKGLEPLALLILEQTNTIVETEAMKYITAEVPTTLDALQGARDIIAETIAETASTRQALRNLFSNQAMLSCKVLDDKKDAAIKYKDYFDYNQLAKDVPGHRFLAMYRANTEQLCSLIVLPENEVALQLIEKQFVKGNSESSVQVQKACKESYNRLLKLSLELELKMQMKLQADEEAIQVFAENLRQLLLASPLGGKKLLAIDPGYRTGCKVVCISATGDLLSNTLIYIHEKHKLQEAEHILREQVQLHGIEAIAIGDGTAGRETEQFIKTLNLKLPIFLVNEDGASVYSASPVAREEFPDYDITVRGAVSIGRRLQDPLAELVKIDPKSIGVGQYQHDVNQMKLKQKLDATIESCVNKVGVNLNTASKQLLSYVSGIGESLAQNIVDKRKEIGAFTNREQLKSVSRMGDKAFEQCAGFLRIKNASHILDNSAVHPESYALAEKIVVAHNLTLEQIIGNSAEIEKIKVEQYKKEENYLTIVDIINELKKPGLDPRPAIEEFEFAAIYSINDVKVNDILPGVVTNLTKFGAFVDIGVKQDGLVHISEIANKFIKDPAEVLHLNQKVNVKVLEVDINRNRILLSIKQLYEKPQMPTKSNKNVKVEVEKPIETALAELLNKFKK